MDLLQKQDDNLYSYGAETKLDGLPPNSKQIGGVDESVRIYMEDYVYTYLQQYAKSAEGKEKMAVLTGRHMQIDGMQTLIISGAIQAKGVIREADGLEFGEDTWEYIGEECEKFFRGLEIVGWAHLQPGFGAFLTAKDEKLHHAYFTEKWQVLFVFDYTEKAEAFFLANESGQGLRQAKGHFIYYDKNQEMQEYMLENRMTKPKEPPVKQRPRSGRKPSAQERMDAAQEIREVLERRTKAAAKARKERYRMLTGVSVGLCVICLCIGMALAHSFQRLQVLEAEMTQIQDDYTLLQAQQQTQTEQSAQVFLTQTEQSQNTKDEDLQETAQNVQENTQSGIWHTVEEGDNLNYISTLYYGSNSGVEKIMAANDISDPNKIYCGQELMIP